MLAHWKVTDISTESPSDATSRRHVPEPEERFLTALRTEAANAARLNLGQIQRAFSAAFPHLDGSPNRRAKLASLLDSLVALDSVRLPADRVRGWQNLPVPALPL